MIPYLKDGVNTKTGKKAEKVGKVEFLLSYRLPLFLASPVKKIDKRLKTSCEAIYLYSILQKELLEMAFFPAFGGEEHPVHRVKIWQKKG